VLNGIWAADGPVPCAYFTNSCVQLMLTMDLSAKEDVIGGISAILWALTILPLLKYVCSALAPLIASVTMPLGVHIPVFRNFGRLVTHSYSEELCTHLSFVGEGGTFALYQGLFPRAQEDPDADRVLTGETYKGRKNDTSTSPRIAKYWKWPLLIWVRWAPFPLGLLLISVYSVFSERV
jgi:KUP system potassium uptake protein